MPYATLAELRNSLKLASTESRDDTYLKECLTAAQGFIESPECCNRKFEASDDTTRYQELSQVMSDGRTLRLNYDLAASPTTVTNGDGQVIPGSAYILLERDITPHWAIRLKLSSGYLWSYGDDPDNAIAIAGRWAYSVEPPENIKKATLILAKWFYQQKVSNSGTDQPVIAPSGFMIMPSKLPTVFWNMVHGYQRKQ